MLLNKNGNEIAIEKLTPLVIDKKYINFLLEITMKQDHMMAFDGYEVIAWDENNNPVEMELYISGTIKWDGCSHVLFGEHDEDGNQNGYLHLCGAHEWRKHIKIMTEVYKFASENITNFDKTETI